MKVVILTANFGNGHLAVANNIKMMFADDDVKIYNPIRMKSLMITGVTEYLYNNVVCKNTRNPLVSSIYYTNYKVAAKSNITNLAIRREPRSVIKEIIRLDSPDIVFVTFPMDVIIPRDVVKKPKIINVITDYTFENIWYSHYADHYIVASDRVKLKLLKSRPHLEKNVHVFGIPCNPTFNCKTDYKELNTVLINLGAVGAMSFYRLTELVDKICNINLKVIIICGKNIKLYNRLSEYYKNQNVEVVGFTSQMGEYILNSDVVITKAGGLSVCEALYVGVPMIINRTRSIKGQESDNIKLIDDYGLGFSCFEDEIFEYLLKLVEDDYYYKNCVENIKKMRVVDQENLIKKLVNDII